MLLRIFMRFSLYRLADQHLHQALTTNSFSGGTTLSRVDTGDVTSHMTTITSSTMSGSMTTSTPSTYTAATAGVTSTSNGMVCRCPVHVQLKLLKLIFRL